MLSTTGNFRGCRRNCICRTISSRPQVVAKKSRSATMRALKVVGVTPALVMCSW